MGGSSGWPLHSLPRTVLANVVYRLPRFAVLLVFIVVVVMSDLGVTTAGVTRTQNLQPAQYDYIVVVSLCSQPPTPAVVRNTQSKPNQAGPRCAIRIKSEMHTALSRAAYSLSPAALSAPILLLP